MHSHRAIFHRASVFLAYQLRWKYFKHVVHLRSDMIEILIARHPVVFQLCNCRWTDNIFNLDFSHRRRFNENHVWQIIGFSPAVGLLLYCNINDRKWWRVYPCMTSNEIAMIY